MRKRIGHRTRPMLELLESRWVPSVADLAVTITDGLTEATPGSVLPYTIEITNRGPDAVSNVTIADDFSSTTGNLFSVNFWYSETFGGATVTQSGAFGEFSIGANMPAGSRVVISADVQIQLRTFGT